MTSSKIKVCHIITGLGSGGAEAMLHKISRDVNKNKFEFSVISLSGDGKYGDLLRDIGIRVTTLNLRGGTAAILQVGTLLKAIQSINPDIVQGWMPHGNIAALTSRPPFRHKVPVLWNIRNTIKDDSHLKGFTRNLVRMSQYLSSIPQAIIYNSRKGAEDHEAIGYNKASRIIIPNGFDTTHYQPSLQVRNQLIAQLNLSTDKFLIGLIARFHSMKNHAGFIKAARKVADSHPEACFILAGSGINNDNEALNTLISQAGLTNHFYLLGEQKDPHKVIAALDLLVLSSSSGEGFPNVVGEAMSCEVPCIVTDVGDAAFIVGDTGLVVQPNDIVGLSQAILTIIQEDPIKRKSRGALARDRIKQNFSLSHITRQYEVLYNDLYSKHKGIK